MSNIQNLMENLKGLGSADYAIIRCYHDRFNYTTEFDGRIGDIKFCDVRYMLDKPSIIMGQEDVPEKELSEYYGWSEEDIEIAEIPQRYYIMVIFKWE